MPSNGRLVVDGASPRFAAALETQGRRYRKVAEVRADRVSRPQPVKTVLLNGQTETTNRAEKGDYIVTAGTGERWVVRPDAFAQHYSAKPGAKNVYVAQGEVIAVQNPFGCPIEIIAPWGKKQAGEADCMVADALDPATGERGGEPYLIARAEFEGSYRAV
ncbi:PGDYG domain-containing protein [Rhodomicrobium sp. Az07]|uniref:PGDYG domain-containing protein n=1 Tax=Rhodomicrobium sp. Az07 TaxID=2839034 RepID=UPI001BECEC4A|nr:PGDYG domain-containing protein [Rhodomicrobium sp. Az07]MBT3070014.1 PGDYG domain-containing protein [Rhodomicrobium sp. Az07]